MAAQRSPVRRWTCRRTSTLGRRRASLAGAEEARRLRHTGERMVQLRILDLWGSATGPPASEGEMLEMHNCALAPV